MPVSELTIQPVFQLSRLLFINQNEADKAVRKKKCAVTPTILELSTEKFACLQLSPHSFPFSFMIKTTKMLAILKANPPFPPPPPPTPFDNAFEP